MEDCYAVTIKRTYFVGMWYFKFDVWDYNKSRIINGVNWDKELVKAAKKCVYDLSQYILKLNVKHLTVITDWEELIKGTYENNFHLSDFLKNCLESVNFIVINPFDSEMVHQFYDD